jgi:flotillin
MAVLIAFIFGVLLVATPIVLQILGIPVGTGTQVGLTGSGVALILFSGVAFVFTRLYQKTKASEAFVRTGQGGAKVIQDGGAVIIPFIHELTRVSLRTIKLEVQRAGVDALITHDKLRADVRAEFFVRVNPQEDAVLQAARSLGEAMDNPEQVKLLVEDKLVSALRTAAATKSLEALNSERDSFLEDVTKLLQDDLKNNGLVLETVTISSLDQTDPKFLKTNNIFDAQGARKIAEITESSLTERNRLVRDGEERRKQQDVENKKRILALDQQEKEAMALQNAEVQRIQAQADRDAQMKVIEMERETHLAAIEKTKALEVAETARQQALALAEAEKAQAVQLANEATSREVAIAREKREQATLVTQQEKEAAVAAAQAERAEKERLLAQKEAEVEKAQQEVETIKVTAEAERAKAKSIVEAQAEAERDYLRRSKQADAESYQIEAAARARKAAADAEAEAVRKGAEAAAEAEKQRAAGDMAKAMVPIEVKKAEVAVERERVETVIKPELEAREKHGKVAQDFEIAKLQVNAEKEVRIAMAQAQATMFQRIDAKLYGTPEQVNEMIRSFGSGQKFATQVEGLLENLSDGTKEQVVGVVRQLTEAATTALAPEPPTAAAPVRKEDKNGKPATR